MFELHGVLDFDVMLPIIEAHSGHFQGRWEQRHWMNVPGPFYGALTDTCLTGPAEAPENVLLDRECQEFLFRQPNTLEEVRRVCAAAASDPCMGYAFDGNRRWTLTLIREWWGRKTTLVSEIRYLPQQFREIAELELVLPRYAEFADYITTDLVRYLRVYAFYVEHDRPPLESEALPVV